ncbi:Haemolysin secretion/activation protein ShlB/FhaC/HecB [Fusobacterium necrophorum subsp. necrophorum]|nr:Haemolysin secretion/activation protein ShlB/FhaC/HecB [Fusobacterium necrophorum subsp. necrophorum]
MDTLIIRQIFRASYTSDHLLDANKFEMGGLNSVRGFKESTIKGDKGIYMSNTFSFEREGISPFIGFDFGYLGLL